MGWLLHKRWNREKRVMVEVTFRHAPSTDTYTHTHTHIHTHTHTHTDIHTYMHSYKKHTSSLQWKIWENIGTQEISLFLARETWDQNFSRKDTWDIPFWKSTDGTKPFSNDPFWWGDFLSFQRLMEQIRLMHGKAKQLFDWPACIIQRWMYKPKYVREK